MLVTIDMLVKYLDYELVIISINRLIAVGIDYIFILIKIKKTSVCDYLEFSQFSPSLSFSFPLFLSSISLYCEILTLVSMDGE